MTERELWKHRAWAALWWALALGWIAVLFLLSGQSAEESAELSGGLADWLRRLPLLCSLDGGSFETVLRKTAHFGIFAVEGFLLGNAFRFLPLGKRLRRGLLFLACAVLAVLNEVSQCFAEGRSCEVRDMFIDFSGAAVGVLAAAALIRTAARRNGKR